MSTIEKLTIQGIRSFGVFASDRQEMTFYSPLTLIVGQNGCGKTTIIECLKYALTSDMPPGCNKGQSFVHDPKIFSHNECKGQVKLKVKNIKGEKVTVIRSMRMSLKRNKWTFDTLESLLNFENEGDAVSRRIRDVDAELTEFMGVSKAIINNVLFCHQEESSWPLDEGKKLKDKFDAIFGTSEYNKAIEKLIKLRKDQMADLKVKESDLKHTTFLKEQMEEKNSNLEKIEKELRNLEKNCKDKDGEIDALQQELDKLNKVEMDFSKLSNELTRLSTELKNSNDHLKNLRSKIKKIFPGSIEELNEEIKNFQERMQEKKSELLRLEKNLDSGKVQSQRILAEKQEADKKISNLINKRQTEQEHLAERASKIKDICESLAIPLDSDDLECRGRAINEQMRKIETAITAENSKINKTSGSHEDMERELQKEIDCLREENTKIEADIQSKTKQKQELEKDKANQDRTLETIKVNTRNLEKLNENIKMITDKMAEIKNIYDFDVEKQKITEKKQEILKLQDEFSKVDKRLDFLNSISATNHAITTKKTELQNKDQEIKRLKNKHHSNIQIIFGARASTITENYKRQVSAEYNSTKKRIDEVEAKIRQLTLAEKGLEIKKNNQKADIKKYQKELEKDIEKIEEKCGSASSFEELLIKSKENVDKYQIEFSAQASSKSMFQNYISKIEEEPCCPLCHKDLSAHEQSSLGCELSEKIEHIPQNIQKYKTLLSKEKQKYESLIELKPSIENIAKLEKTIPELKVHLKKMEDEFTATSSELENQQLLLAEPQSNLEMINSMMGDMTLLDQYCKDKDDISKALEILRAKLPVEDQESIEDVKQKKQRIDADLKEGHKSINVLEKTYDENQKKFHALRDKINELKDKQNEHQKGLQSRPQIEERIKEISNKLKELVSELESLQVQKRPLKDRLEKAIQKKESQIIENRNIIKSMSHKLDLIKSDNKEIQRLSKELDILEPLDLSNAIKSLKESLKTIDNRLKEKESAIKELSKEIEQLKAQTMNQEIEERDLKENKEYKVLEEKKAVLQEQKDILDRDMGKMDIKTVSSKRLEVINKRSEHERSKGNMAGRIGEINGQVKKLEEEMSRPAYKDAEKNYRRCYYDVQITKKVITDLGQYRQVLEIALMKFHAQKMENINRLIREFWRTIYRGNDIDYIKIQCDTDSTAGTADKKRNFNYRVVQSKNNHEIDMRGRCSAGQRVLACLIIRMALAETFSVNCGVLALDEPTTNLDKQNIMALCDALNRLVEGRRFQQNFMLIVITHDEDFIETLGRIEVYYKISRNDDGKSEIRQVSLE